MGTIVEDERFTNVLVVHIGSAVGCHVLVPKHFKSLGVEVWTTNRSLWDLLAEQQQPTDPTYLKRY